MQEPLASQPVVQPDAAQQNPPIQPAVHAEVVSGVHAAPGESMHVAVELPLLR